MSEQTAMADASAVKIEDLARLAIDGDKGALDLVLRELQPDLYGSRSRMLWSKEDAEDATQEILVRVVTRLSQFDFRSRLRTRAVPRGRELHPRCEEERGRAPASELRTFRRQPDRQTSTSTSTSDVEQSVLIEEVKVGCTLAMLQCLDLAASACLRARRDYGAVRTRSGRSAGHLPGAVSKTPAACTNRCRVLYQVCTAASCPTRRRVTAIARSPPLSGTAVSIRPAS